jgi:hypothetical protein
MNAYVVTTTDGAILGGYTASEILRGFETNEDIIPGTSWQETFIITRAGSAVSPHIFLLSAFPDLVAGFPAQPDDPEPDIDAEAEDIKGSPTDKIDAYRKLRFEWREDIWGVSVNDSDGEEIGFLELYQIRDLMRRGVLLSSQKVVGYRVAEWAGPADDRYADSYYAGELWILSDIVQELERSGGHRSIEPDSVNPAPPPSIPADPSPQTVHRIRTAIQQFRAGSNLSAIDSPAIREQMLREMEGEINDV